MNKEKGFTLIETAIVLVFIALVTGFVFIQKSDFDTYLRDTTRKTAINAMYYALEEDFFKTHNYYPETISEANLPTVDPSLWTDPDGIPLGTPLSSYLYTPANCNQGRCKEYTLTATLEKESAFTRTNR